MYDIFNYHEQIQNISLSWTKANFHARKRDIIQIDMNEISRHYWKTREVINTKRKIIMRTHIKSIRTFRSSAFSFLCNPCWMHMKWARHYQQKISLHFSSNSTSIISGWELEEGVPLLPLEKSPLGCHTMFPQPAQRTIWLL